MPYAVFSAKHSVGWGPFETEEEAGGFKVYFEWGEDEDGISEVVELRKIPEWWDSGSTT